MYAYCTQTALHMTSELCIAISSLRFAGAGQEGNRSGARVRGAHSAAGGGAPAGCQGARQAGAACFNIFSTPFHAVRKLILGIRVMRFLVLIHICESN